MLTVALADIPTLATMVLDSSEPIRPADTHTREHRVTHLIRFTGSGCSSGIRTRVSSAGGPLRGHAVPLQVCVRHGQQVVVADATADSWLGVEEPAGVVSWDVDSHVIVGGRETLLDTQELINTKLEDRRCLWAGGRLCELTQILCLLSIRSMSSLTLRYLSSNSGLWPAESSASMSGLSQPFKPFLRSV